MKPIKKAYAYITRVKVGKKQVLVFEHVNVDAGIQVPKGTVEPGEDTYNAVIREVREETGLTDFKIERLLADDLWENKDGRTHHRFFYEVQVGTEPDQWDHSPTGGGAEEELTFRFFWATIGASLPGERGVSAGGRTSTDDEPTSTVETPASTVEQPSSTDQAASSTVGNASSTVRNASSTDRHSTSTHRAPTSTDGNLPPSYGDTISPAHPNLTTQSGKKIALVRGHADYLTKLLP